MVITRSAWISIYGDFMKKKNLQLIAQFLDKHPDDFGRFLEEENGIAADESDFIIKEFMEMVDGMEDRACRVCGCTDHDCSQCVEKTGEPCHWVEEDLCSACVDEGE